MISSFVEWAKIKEEKLNEVATVGGSAEVNPYLYMNQKEGDWVWFGVNQLFKMYQETGRVPKNLNVAKLVPYMGRIVTPDDPNKSKVKELVKVVLPKSLGAMGYRSLKSKVDKAGHHFIEVPTKMLQNFTSILGTGAVLSGEQLWLAATNNFQNKRMEILKRAEQESQAQDRPMTPEISDQDVEAARAALGVDKQGQRVRYEPPKPSLSDLVGGEEEAPLSPMAKYRMRNREILPWNREEPERPLHTIRQKRLPVDPETMAMRQKLFAGEAAYNYYPTSSQA